MIGIMTIQIDVSNRKGGTGKSETALHLAIYLASIKGKKVLLIDVDGSNCSLSCQLLKMERDGVTEGFKPPIHPKYDDLIDKHPTWSGISSVASIFFDEPVIPYGTAYENLDILPAYTAALDKVEETHRSLVEKNVYHKYEAWRNNEDIVNCYDFIVIDHSPTKKHVADAALSVSDGLIIPTQALSASLNGMKTMLQIWTQINQARTISNPLRLLSIIITNYDKRVSIQTGIVNSIEQNAVASKYLAPEYIPTNKFFQEKDYERQKTKKGSIFDLPEGNPIREKVEKNCEYIYKGVME